MTGEDLAEKCSGTSRKPAGVCLRHRLDEQMENKSVRRPSQGSIRKYANKILRWEDHDQKVHTVLGRIISQRQKEEGG
jgi:hypothetical protein